MPAQANSSRDPHPQITRAKWARDMAQVVQYLFYKHKARSSNSSPTKNKYKKIRWVKDLIRHFTKECTQMTSKYMKRYSIYVLKELQP
jgi:hypothetical protein